MTLETIGLAANIIWAITLLSIIKTVRLKNSSFVSNAIEGNVWLDTGTISFSWFINLYKKYFDIRGVNFLLIINVVSFAVALVSILLLIGKSFI